MSKKMNWGKFKKDAEIQSIDPDSKFIQMEWEILKEILQDHGVVRRRSK